MAINQTINSMKTLLSNITQDLSKAEGGNKAASQRVRTGTIRLEKVAKLFRKESIKFDKQNKGRKKPAKKAAKKAAPKKAAPKAAKKAAKKPAARKTNARARSMSLKKRHTAKLPAMRAAR